MNIERIKTGRWYRTRMGFGKVVRVVDHEPPCVEIEMTWPLPWGLIYLHACHVLREVKPEEVPVK